MLGYIPSSPANFKELAPENDLDNFLSVHETNLYSVGVAEPQQTRQRLPPGYAKNGISHFCHERINAKVTVLSRRIFNQSIGIEFTRNRYFFIDFQSRSLDPKDVCLGATGTPRQKVPWDHVSKIITK